MCLSLTYQEIYFSGRQHTLHVNSLDKYLDGFICTEYNGIDAHLYLPDFLYGAAEKLNSCYDSTPQIYVISLN